MASEKISITPPATYSSVKSPCVFGFDRSDKSVMPITIAGYAKNIIGFAPAVNVADYYRYKFGFDPILEEQLSVSSALSLNRLVEAWISYIFGSVRYESEHVLLSASLVDITEKKGLLSDVTIRHVGKGCVDEFTVLSNGHVFDIRDKYRDSLIEVQNISHEIPNGMQVISFPVMDNCHVVIENPATGQYQEIEYICHENMSGMRLAWVNRYGAIDQYDFEIVSEQAVEFEKTCIYTKDGYFLTDISADDYTTVTTRALSAEQLKSMTDILISDHVFLIEDGAITEVDVVSDSATTLNNNSIVSLSVRFRPKKRRI